MNYHNITKTDMLNGDGLRVVLWLSGCSHKCKGCQNEETWDPCSGLKFDEKAKEELLCELKKDYISGITFSGGDPLFESNRQEVGALMEEIAKTFPNKSIWCYTGYTFEQIKDLPFISYIDVLVDGMFIECKKELGLKWKGSSNQRVIDVKQTLKKNEVVLKQN